MATRRTIDVSNWLWNCEMSTLDHNYYRDWATKALFLEERLEDGTYRYCRADESGKEIEYLGFAEYGSSYDVISIAGKQSLELHTATPT